MRFRLLVATGANLGASMRPGQAAPDEWVDPSTAVLLFIRFNEAGASSPG